MKEFFIQLAGADLHMVLDLSLAMSAAKVLQIETEPNSYSPPPMARCWQMSKLRLARCSAGGHLLDAYIEAVGIDGDPEGPLF
jgi:hypothetical protein